MEDLINALKQRVDKNKIKPMYFTSEKERKEILIESERIHLKDIDFSFSHAHLGFKGGFNHMVLSSTGAGKSTFARTLLFRALRKHKVLWYSTEETFDEFRAYCAKSRVDNNLLRNLFYVKEDENLSIIEALNRFVVENKCELVIFDNYTTCKEILRKDQNGQRDVIKKLRDTIIDLNVPMVTIAHTSAENKGVSITKPDPYSIRGFKDMAMEAQVIYALETVKFEKESDLSFGDGETMYETVTETLLSIIKGRCGGRDTSYRLAYNSSTGFYDSESQVSDKLYSLYKNLAYNYARGNYPSNKKKKAKE